MKEKQKNLFEFLKKPNLLFTILCYVLFVCFGTLAIVFACIEKTGFWMYFSYSGLGVTFFYCCYLFIRYDLKVIIMTYKNLKQKAMNKNKIVQGYFNDYYSRTMINTIISLVLGIVFVLYNAFVGLYFHSVWNGSISFYYMFLVGIRILYLLGEYKLFKNQDLEKQEKDKKRAKMFIFGGVLMLCLSIALAGPVTMLVLSKKQAVLPMWVAIADATYVFYKLTMCIIAFVKTRQNNVLSVKGIKNLNLTTVSVALLSLENTMILTFSESTDNSMLVITILTALSVMILNLVVAISTIRGGKAELKSLKNNEKSEEMDG